MSLLHTLHLLSRDGTSNIELVTSIVVMPVARDKAQPEVSTKGSLVYKSKKSLLIAITTI